MIDLWLDDMREAPIGWTWVTDVEQAKQLLQSGKVRKASLDHDLGACDKCNGKTAEEWPEDHDYKSTPHCDHVGTGYTLVCWMEEHNIWPQEKPMVHSANPVGRERMISVINNRWCPPKEHTNDGVFG